jgi:ribosome-binding ATPase YchF (GTP1/OBG family)
VEPDPALAHTTQSTLVPVPEPRVDALCAIYKPKKVTYASLELVDTPGLTRDHAGSAQKLALIREAGCLVIVAAGFGGADALADLRNFEDDLLIADLDIVSNRVERLRESIKKPRPNREEQEAELKALEPLHAALEQGRALREMELSPEQSRAIRSFQLFTEKPRLVVINSTDDAQQVSPEIKAALPKSTRAVAISLPLQLELAAMPAEERDEFCREMEVEPRDRDELLRTIMDVSGQMLFFTAGEKEVRTWMIRKGCTAVEAAGEIHTDLAKGFIRAATMNCGDLVRLGSEREVKAANLMRQEPRDYVIQDGDVIEIRHN